MKCLVFALFEHASKLEADWKFLYFFFNEIYL